MCGRFVITSAPDAIRRLLRYEEQPNFPPRYNIAPTQPIPVVRLERGVRHFALARWGLIPSWVKDLKQFALLFNARIEGIEDKPAYRAAMLHRRCLIPADGFYEWKKEGKARRPYFVCARDRRPFAFAGLWESWIDPDGNTVESATIVTCPANSTLAPIHDRMPVILPPEHHQAWLDTDNVEGSEAIRLASPTAEGFLARYEVSSRVNSANNDGAENVAPLAQSGSLSSDVR
jgi:putative SOS response-associated peptidase YedK